MLSSSVNKKLEPKPYAPFSLPFAKMCGLWGIFCGIIIVIKTGFVDGVVGIVELTAEKEVKMKSYTKGLITGILIGSVLCAAPVLATNIDAVLNTVRININGIDKVQWGEEMTLSDGTTAPTSLVYNGTTYLPLRKIGSLLGKNVYWNGDSNTVSVTGTKKNPNTVAQKADSYGNVWTYYTFEDDNGYKYLGVKDSARGYDRIYCRGSQNVGVTDDAVYFVKTEGQYSDDDYYYGHTGTLMKISFDNDIDTQDGEEVFPLDYYFTQHNAFFDGEYLFYIVNSPGNAQRCYFRVYNYVTGETVIDSESGTWIIRYNLEFIESDENQVVYQYDYDGGGGQFRTTYKFAFDKTTHTLTTLKDDESEE